MKKFVFIVSVILMTGLVASCNTMEGFGKDLQKVGDKISDSADK